ncbi:uncharacterized protein [Amphiura filiformis]|uniref:uncharacterized protein n=1 Tax=Amphiura filiformis TaxID=82378 RepID=UPI003B21A630
MARLRFPGRPGQRFGRSLIRFMPEEAKNCRNRFFNLTANIQKNLRGFYDLFGDSDEEDNFPGFTTHEIGIPPDKEFTEAFDDGDFSPLFELPDGKVSTRFECVRQSLKALPATDRTGKRLKTAARRSYLDMHRGTDGVQRKSNVVKKVEEVRSGKAMLNKVKNIKMKAKDKIPTVMGQKALPAKGEGMKETEKKPKSIRFRFKLMGGGRRAKILSSPEKRAKKVSPDDKKSARKNRAKELLAKARQRKAQDSSVLEGKRNVKMSRKYTDMVVTGVADMHFLQRTTSPPASPPPTGTFTSPSHSGKNLSPSPGPPRVPRQFVLPYKSSRSSRVIKPSKRFIEEMGTASPPKKQLKLDGAMDITRDMKQELISSSDEFTTPEKFPKTLLKTKELPGTDLVHKKGSFATPKSTKVLSTKAKKHSDKNLKASKKSQIVDVVTEEHIDVDIYEEVDADVVEEEGVAADVDTTVKTSKVFKLKSEKVKSLEKRKKEKLKAKKKKLQEKKQKKLEEKKRKKEELLLAKKKKKKEELLLAKKKKKKKKLKKGKSPKKKKDSEKENEMELGVDVEKGVEVAHSEEPKRDELFMESKQVIIAQVETEEMEKLKKSDSSSSKQVEAAKGVKNSPRRIRKLMKKKLKEEAKQLKKTYNDLKKSIEMSEMCPIEGEERVPVNPEDASRRKKQLKELAKKHKEVCKALRKFQKDSVPSLKEGKKKKKDVRGDTLTYRILDESMEREQKENLNLGPLRSPNELVKSGILMDASSSKAIAEFVNRKMTEAMEADMSPEQAQAASQREMKRRRQQLKEQSKKKGQTRCGPRIKHVSRRASVALGYSPVKFTEEDSLAMSAFALSALSPDEKRKLLDPGRAEKGRWSSDDDGAKPDDRDEDFLPGSVKKRSTFGRRRPLSKKHPFGPKKFKPLKRLKPLKSAGTVVHVPGGPLTVVPRPHVTRPTNLSRAVKGLRRRRCGECEGCLIPEDCATCINCLDKPKFGGPGTKKQCCIYRRCSSMKHKAPPVDRRQHPKYGGGTKMVTSSPKAGSLISELTSFDRVLYPQSHPESPAASVHSSPVSTAGSLVPGPSGTGPVVPGPSGSGPAGPKIKRPSAPVVAKSMLLRNSKKKGAIKELDLRRESPSPPPPKLKLSIQQELSKHLIKIDFQEDYDLDIAWMRGMSIISSQPMIPRTVCYLCGSTGKHDLIYCNVCCEPYHEFCLDEEERPLEGDLDKWCCRMCKFCSVCGRQDHLLNCAKCQTSYHAECLGPNYPTKPSKRRKIWVCTKCVKCKSCGATTPGQHSSAQWSHDFSLCQDCDKLFDKGNYCPVCNRCYEDDDYESKMMECAKCQRWIHAKCEGLTDDMYHIMTDLPETVPYTCVVCDPVRPAKWQIELAEEMQAGFLNVMTAIFACKSATHLIYPDKRKKKSHRTRSPADSSRRSTASPALSDVTSQSRSSTPLEGSQQNSQSRSTTPLEGAQQHSQSRSTTPLEGVQQHSQSRSTTPLDGSCDSDSLQTALRTFNNSSLRSKSPISSTPTRTENSEVGSDPKSDSKNSMTLREEMSVTVKREALNEQLDLENASKESSPSVTTDEVITVEDTVSNVEGPSDMEVDIESTESKKPCKTPDKSDAASSKVVVEQSKGDAPESGDALNAREQAPDERTKPDVDEALKTSTPSVPESSESVLASVESSQESSEESTEAKNADEANTKESETLSESSRKDENQLESDQKVTGSQSAHVEETVRESSQEEGDSQPEHVEETVQERSQTDTGNQGKDSEREVENQSVTEGETESQNKPEIGVEEGESKQEGQGSGSSQEGICETEVAKDTLDDEVSLKSEKKMHESESVTGTSSEGDKEQAMQIVSNDDKASEINTSQGAADSTEEYKAVTSEPMTTNSVVQSAVEDNSQTKVTVEQPSNMSGKAINAEQVAEQTEAATPEPMSTDSVAPSTGEHSSQTKVTVEQATDATAEQGAADVSFTDSLDLSADMSTTPGSVNRSRSESTDSAPETDITEAVHGASRRVTRLSLQQGKNPDASQAVVSRRSLMSPMNSPPAASNMLLPSASGGGSLGDDSVMSLMATVIDKVIHGEPLSSLEVDLQQQPQNQVQSTMFSTPFKANMKPEEDKNAPRDFLMVKAKVQAGAYNSIIEFCNDCVRIIQSSMLRETSQTVRKNNRVARTVFTKVMEKMFPWFNINNSSCWEESIKYPNGMLPDAVLPPHRDHEYAQWKHRNQHIPSTLQPSPLKKFTPAIKKISDTNSEASDSNRTETPPPDPSIEDLRRCALCGQYSDDDPNNAGRLLYCGQNDWIHINCALWSAEVFEEVDGSLINVHTAISRGCKMRCDYCHKTGATVGCCTPNCPANYHFMCARQVNALFQEDKKVFCARHSRMVRKKLVDNDMFAVLRRVCVSFESMKMNRQFINGVQVNRINFMVGSLTLDSLGRLGPLSGTKDTLFPIEYKIQRVFWSTQDPRRRCVYTVRITEFKPDKIANPRIIEETNLTTAHDPTYDPAQFKKLRMLRELQDPLSSSFSSTRKRKRTSSEDKLSLSWPRQKSAGLSEKTLKHLPQSVVREMSTPSPSTTSPSPVLDDEGDLTDNLSLMVASLNDAAAQSHGADSMETTFDIASGDINQEDADNIEINIELDDSFNDSLESVEKLIGEALSEEQSLDQVVMFMENLPDGISDEGDLGVELVDTENKEVGTDGEKSAVEESSTESREIVESIDNGKGKEADPGMPGNDDLESKDEDINKAAEIDSSTEKSAVEESSTESREIVESIDNGQGKEADPGMPGNDDLESKDEDIDKAAEIDSSTEKSAVEESSTER